MVGWPSADTTEPDPGLPAGLARAAAALVLCALLAAAGCSPSSPGAGAQLSGEWKSDSVLLRFTGETAWVEERGPGGRNGKRGRLTIKGRVAEIEGIGTAELLDDGRLHLKARIENPLASSTIDGYLVESTPGSSTSDAATVTLRVSEQQLNTWNAMRGRYALYAHREASIARSEDLSGKTLFIALVIDNPDEISALGGRDKFAGTMVGDGTGLIRAFAMKTPPSAQNTADLYLSQLLETPDQIGLVVESAADSLGVSKDPRLVRLALTK